MDKKLKKVLSLIASIFFIASILVNVNYTPVKATGYNEDWINQKISVNYTNDSSKITSATIYIQAAKTASSSMPISTIKVDNNDLNLSDITLDGYAGKSGLFTVTKDGTYSVYVSTVSGMAYKYTDVVVSGIGKSIGSYSRATCNNNSSYSVGYYTSGYGKTVTLYVDMDATKIKINSSFSADVDITDTVPYDMDTGTAFEKYIGNIYKFTYSTNGTKVIKMVGGYTDNYVYNIEINQIDKTGPTINAQVSDNSWTNAESLTVTANVYDGQSMTSADNIFLDNGNLLTNSNFSDATGWSGNQVQCYAENCSESPTGRCLSINASQAGYGFFTRAMNGSIETNKAYLTFYAKCEKEENFYGGIEGVECYNFIVKTTWTKITIPLTKCKGKSGTIILYPRGACGKFSIHSPTLTDGWLPSGYVESTTEMSNISGRSSVSTSLQVFDNGTYTLKARDKAGNISTKEIKIQNIDRVPPTADVSLSSNKYQNSLEIRIKNVADEGGSGLNNVYGPDGKAIQIHQMYGYYAYYVTENNKTYDFKIKDFAGNVTTKSVTVNNLDLDKPQAIVTSSTEGWSKEDVEVTVTGTDWEMGSAWLGSGNLIKNSSFIKEFSGWTKNNLQYSSFWVSNGHKALCLGCTGQYQGIYQTVSGTFKNATLSVWVRADSAEVGKQMFFGVQGGKTKTVTITSDWTRYDLDLGDVTNPTVIFYSASNGVTFSMRDPMMTSDGVYSQQWIPNKNEINDCLDMSNLVKSVTNKFTVTQTGTYTAYVHDGAGNEVTKDVEVKIDKVAPTGDIQFSNNPTNSSVTVYLDNINDEGGSGIAKVLGPNGNEIEKNEQLGYYRYSVSENGTYSFKIVDNAGNETTKTATISSIDKVNPTLTNVNYDNSGAKTKGTITFTASDVDSGIKSIKVNDVDLTLTEDGNYSYDVNSNGDYKIDVVDKAGNPVSQTVTVTNIDSSKPTVNQSVDEYSNGEAKVTVKATPNGAAKIKGYSYVYRDKTSRFALRSVLNEEVTGEGDSVTLDVNDESYVEGSFTTETNQVTTFTVDGYNVIINEAIHEDNWLNRYIAAQLGKTVEELTIEDVESIKTINAENQGITEIPYTMKYMSELEVINLADNNITKIPSFVGNLENLTEINLSGNYNLDKTTIPATSAKVYTPTSSTVTSTDKTSTSEELDITFSQTNTIELTLSTNEISFGDINGIIESTNTTPNKLVINVQSSLSYDLNINAETDFIGQTDNSNIIPIEKLQYNVNNNDYISMSKNTIAIASDKAATLGNKDSYSLDFKLQPTIGYAKDSYKTNIKVTALQK